MKLLYCLALSPKFGICLPASYQTVSNYGVISAKSWDRLKSLLSRPQMCSKPNGCGYERKKDVGGISGKPSSEESVLAGKGSIGEVLKQHIEMTVVCSWALS